MIQRPIESHKMLEPMNDVALAIVAEGRERLEKSQSLVDFTSSADGRSLSLR